LSVDVTRDIWYTLSTIFDVSIYIFFFGIKFECRTERFCSLTLQLSFFSFFSGAMLHSQRSSTAVLCPTGSGN
jgi:hypothetical protein